MPTRFVGWIALAWAVAWPSISHSQASFQAVPGSSYREVVNPKLSVSGQMVVGLVVGTIGYHSRLWARVPPLPANSDLRIEVDSPDGRFHGSGLYQGTSDRPAWAELRLLAPGTGSQFPSSMTKDETAALAELPPAGGRPRRLLLVSWEEPEPAGKPGWKDKQLHIMVNSRRATRMEVRVTGTDAKGECARVASGQVKRFDTLCRLDMKALTAGAQGSPKVRLLRYDGFDVEQFDFELVL